MTEQNLIIFDDGNGRFGPMTDMRAAFEMRTGAWTTMQRIQHALQSRACALIVPKPLQSLVASRHSVTVNPTTQKLNGSNYLLVNGRWSGISDVENICALSINEALVQPDGQLIAARFDQQSLHRAVDEHDWREVDGVVTKNANANVLYDRPWHVLDQLESALTSDLSLFDLPLASTEIAVNGSCDVKVANDANFVSAPNTLIIAEGGPVVIDRGALIGAMTVLEGPCYIGPNSVIGHHASIRPNSIVGPMCKVSGEVSFSVMHGHSNKAHHGYLGHSLVGEWVNLGAATNVSNLKNTYGSVRVQLERGGEVEDTGRTFHGPIVGDFVRTGIGTRLLTGSCIGTGAMVAVGSYPPKLIDRFAFLTDDGADATNMDKFISTARLMMARRDCELTDAEEQRLLSLAASSTRV